ncbi:MAG: hypothetical protein KKB59_19800 [Spirochaetes bacterium]|nr:hypothetical protein [Spirochaetota bacterium]
MFESDYDWTAVLTIVLMLIFAILFILFVYGGFAINKDYYLERGQNTTIVRDGQPVLVGTTDVKRERRFGVDRTLFSVVDQNEAMRLCDELNSKCR